MAFRPLKSWTTNCASSGEAQVIQATARGSHLIEVLFHQELKSDLVVGAGQNHSAMLNGSEKRLVSEWIDLGAQYYNSPRDGSNNLRGVTGLSENRFQILRCIRSCSTVVLLATRRSACRVAAVPPPNTGFVGCASCSPVRPRATST